jgi:hypothetical protein
MEKIIKNPEKTTKDTYQTPHEASIHSPHSSEQDNYAPIEPYDKHKPKYKPIGKSSLFFLIRHAERQDEDPGRSPRPHANKRAPKNHNIDPTITEYGQHQAEETGVSIIQKIIKLKKEGKLNPKVKPRILCSPYWRCLKTAKKLIDGFGSNEISDRTIYIEVKNVF